MTQPTGNRAPEYDLLLRGGTLIDPGQGVHDRRDVAFSNGKVAAVDDRIDSVRAAEVVDVTGKLITPGLIDIHGHFFHGSMIGTDPDETCLPAGVTTGIDAGSAGWANYQVMRDYVFPTKKTRILSFLHIGAMGLTMNAVIGGELQDMRMADSDRTADAIKENPGFVLGVKVRMHHQAVSQSDAHEALRRARDAADKAKVKLMVHISATPIPLPDILDLLGPGDIATHIFNGNPEGILDDNKKIRPEVKAAARRGVIMDVAHAGVHCDLEVVRSALKQDFLPTTISTDMHNPPKGRTVYGVNDLVSNFHAMGMPLNDAVAASTVRAAEALGLEDDLGSLAPGFAGDAAVFDQNEGQFVWKDTANHTADGKLRLDTFVTVKDGAVVWRRSN